MWLVNRFYEESMGFPSGTEATSHTARKAEPAMEGVYIIGIDLAKQSFRTCRGGSRRSRSARTLGRAGLLGFLSDPLLSWRHFGGAPLGPSDRQESTRFDLVPPVYVKPYVKRHKNVGGLRRRFDETVDAGDDTVRGGKSDAADPGYAWYRPKFALEQRYAPAT